MADLYDLIIIGAGPAGITAAVYAARKRMNLLVLTEDIGGQAAWSGDIENYTGYQFVSGIELASKFEEHMRKFNIPVNQGEPVISLENKEKIISVTTKKGSYQAKTVIVASGKRSRELGVSGEKEYKNKGLTYCATCDGPLFADKDVAIIGGGNSALDACLQLIKIAKNIYMINVASELTGDAIMQEKVKASDKVTVINNAQVSEVVGEAFVKAVKIKRSNQQQEELLPVEGIFVEIGLIPNSDFARELEKNELGEIKVDHYNQTNISGIFAAGDVTDVPEKQIIIAAGEGSKAALTAFRYLSRTK
ncbi:NAD(P)/FAD-dependent oxidoreductase [Candidatus Omnitrophota bacterium]